MRIMFLNPPTPGKMKVSRASRWPEHTKSGTLYYPLWLAYATGYAEKEGFRVFLLDATADSLSFEETAERIFEFDPDLLVIETTTPLFFSDMNFIDNFLRNYDGKIVVTGTHVSARPEDPFKHSKRVDFVARGEYDAIIPELARNLDDPIAVNGISFRKGNKVIHTPPAKPIENLDEIPWVSKVYKKFLNINNYAYALARKPMVQIFTSRGCPNRCVFCQYPQVFSGRRFRARSPEDVVAELEWIKKHMPEVKEIFIEDDTFTVDKQRVARIADLIIEKGLKITWSANVRADVPLWLMKKMKAAGCRLLVVGYESGNDEVLKKIKKGINTRMSREFAKNAKKAGLKVFGCFMLGLPGDTEETLKQTFEFAKELDPEMAFFQQAVPFPGTELYEWAKKNGYLVTEDYSKWYEEDGRLGFLLSYPWLPAEKIRYYRDKFMREYYFRPSFIFKTILRNLHPAEWERILRAFKGYLGFWISELKKRMKR